MTIEPIARIRTDFPSKFGIPRQSGLADNISEIIFEPKYRTDEALRGIDGYSHLWLIWEFTEAKQEKFSPTVRPPRLGGNVRMGVFATRSPFRPNSLGLSCVELIKVNKGTPNGTTLLVKGADILDNTPIYDIKPYIPFSDSIPDALGGFGADIKNRIEEVDFACDIPNSVTQETLSTIRRILIQDPTPHYKNDPERIYAFEYADLSIKFRTDRKKITVMQLAKTIKN
jgi:tRNA (adenine37-N6)-methyltransferase